MIFSSNRSIQSICGVEISDDDDVMDATDDRFFEVEIKPVEKVVAKKKKRSRFAIGTPTKVLEQALIAKQTKPSVTVRKKSPKTSLKKSPSTNSKRSPTVNTKKNLGVKKTRLSSRCQNKSPEVTKSTKT